MRQGSLFDIKPKADPDDAVGLAGMMPSIRAAMNRVAGKDEECRKQIVEKINEVAKREGVPLTKGGGKSIDKGTLDKWLQPAATGHGPTLEAIAIFCLATGDASPMKAALRILGIEAVDPEDLRYLKYGKACASMKKAKAELKDAESRI